MKKSNISGKATLLSIAGTFAMLLMAGCAATAGSATTDAPGQSTSPPAQPASIEKPDPAATGTVVSLNISNRNIKAGDTFSVGVIVDAKVAIRGAQATLIFDPSIVKVNDIAEGNFLKGWADANSVTTMQFPAPTVDNSKGTADIGVAIMGMVPGGPQGKGLLWTYSCTALKDGTVAPTLNNVVLSLQSIKDPTDVVDLKGKDLTVIN
jgi:hypothetical protein